jgi:hypothetical protein
MEKNRIFIFIFIFQFLVIFFSKLLNLQQKNSEILQQCKSLHPK